MSVLNFIKRWGKEKTPIDRKNPRYYVFPDGSAGIWEKGKPKPCWGIGNGGKLYPYFPNAEKPRGKPVEEAVEGEHERKEEEHGRR